MSFERDVNVAVKLMFEHAKQTISRNLRNAVRDKQITLDANKLPGLDLLIAQSIDEGYKQSARELDHVLKTKK